MVASPTEGRLAPDRLGFGRSGLEELTVCPNLFQEGEGSPFGQICSLGMPCPAFFRLLGTGNLSTGHKRFEALLDANERQWLVRWWLLSHHFTELTPKCLVDALPDFRRGCGISSSFLWGDRY